MCTHKLKRENIFFVSLLVWDSVQDISLITSTVNQQELYYKYRKQVRVKVYLFRESKKKNLSKLAVIKKIRILVG